MIDYQVIKRKGKPVFALVDFDEFSEFLEDMEDVLAYDKAKANSDGLRVPGDVVRKVIDEGKSLIQAWREYKGLTQADLAARIGIKQSAVARLETKGRKLRSSTREKVAKALNIDPRLLEY